MNYFKLIQRLYALKYTKDKLLHHPEENVLSHSLQAYKIAKRESNNKELQVAALFHDLGKGVEILGHDKIGVDILESFGYNNPNVLWLIKNHIRIIHFLDGSMNKLSKVKELTQSPIFNELIHLRRIDYKARKKNFNYTIDSDLGIEINDLLEITNES